jgi:hypothetical protein
MSHWFDRLSRGAAAPETTRFDRRTSLKLAGAAALAASPLAAGAAAAPTASAQLTSCDDCRKGVQDAFLAGLKRCLAPKKLLGPFAPVTAYACLWGVKISEFTGRARCKDVACAPPPQPGAGGGGSGTPPPASGSPCAPGTSACPAGRAPVACCYGSDLCCPCASVPGGYICCVDVVGCTCCG